MCEGCTLVALINVSSQHIVCAFFFFATSAAEYDALAEPVCDRRGQPRILFAGEATTRHFPSTVHGAWSTGLREANRLDSKAKAGWHRKGHRSKPDDFSPDILYESSILYGKRPPYVKRPPSVKKVPGKVRIRPTMQQDGTEVRRSPRRADGSHADDGARLDKRKCSDSSGDEPACDGQASSLRPLPHSESDVAELAPVGSSSNRRKLPLGNKVVRVSN